MFRIHCGQDTPPAEGAWCIREPVPNHISARKRQRQRPYAIRKPKEYVAKEPGDIVEVDTLDVRPFPGKVLKHFTARDIISRWDVLEVHTRATSHTASGFIDTLLRRMPFPIRVIQETEERSFKTPLRRNVRGEA